MGFRIAHHLLLPYRKTRLAGYSRSRGAWLLIRLRHFRGNRIDGGDCLHAVGHVGFLSQIGDGRRRIRRERFARFRRSIGMPVFRRLRFRLGHLRSHDFERREHVVSGYDFQSVEQRRIEFILQRLLRGHVAYAQYDGRAIYRFRYDSFKPALVARRQRGILLEQTQRVRPYPRGLPGWTEKVIRHCDLLQVCVPVRTAADTLR